MNTIAHVMFVVALLSCSQVVGQTTAKHIAMWTHENGNDSIINRFNGQCVGVDANFTPIVKWRRAR